MLELEHLLLLLLMLELEYLLMLPSTEKRLSHEKLIGYKTTIQFVALTIEIIRQFPKGNADIIDQLKRGSTSIPFNIAEGAC